MKLRTLALTCTLGFTTLARAEAPRDEISTADADRFVAFIEKVAAAVTTNVNACPKMATAITAVVDANADVIKMATEAKAAGKKLPKAYEAKLREKTKPMEAGLEKCKDDKAVVSAIEKVGKKTKVAPPPAKK
jgi:hypothetical protein